MSTAGFFGCFPANVFMDNNSNLSCFYEDLPFIMSTLELGPSTSTTSSNDEKIAPGISKMRSLPPRTAKDNFLHKCKRRVISKPKKIIQDFNISTESIRKLYLQKTARKFRPASLETIYEEPIITKDEVKLIGIKKLRRSLSCSDGINVSKTIIKNRRLRIKKTFGRKSTHHKIKLEEFLDRFKSIVDTGKNEQGATSEESSENVACVKSESAITDNNIIENL